MIQHTRQSPTQSRGSVPPPTGTDGPEIWGSWAGRRRYELQVTQSPIRARQCGFGDKDRRPLAPAAVAKMIVRREDNTIVDVDDVDMSFFLVTVDLWSADGKQEMNLVLHPSTAERYVPPNPPSKPQRRRNTSTSQQKSGTKTPAGSSTPTPAQTPSSGQGYYPPAATQDGSSSYPHNISSDAPQMWGYPPSGPVDRTTTYPPPVLPSISTFSRNPAGSNSEPWPSASSQEPGSYVIDPALRDSAGPSESRENSDQPNYGTDAYSSSYPNVSPYAQDTSETASSSGLRHPANYTRTLVGPLSANACRLLDEHRKEGIFFLFQDLSVRTEGTFRLRMRLINVGAPPAPESGAIRVHNTVSPVLSQTFTDSFTVYSAKRFPGVPDTTALSIAFGNQGQKLPLRNRHGTGSKRRRRGNASGSDEESDES